ncbi:unnamed protein product [Acanthoscelides obtectus]|uniref:Uncharacterized protein n=1 Tax=Acanthoscelides obtectus TaxID=200917 RepID=A0A9P0PA88_ACAOB|nr:unnamed protein product [Acanthoscelides obtectus]CAK1623662.1 hypothetical protein AOBTE_LOCUS2112 [Acanthoscelides obtectus]
MSSNRKRVIIIKEKLKKLEEISTKNKEIRKYHHNFLPDDKETSASKFSEEE